MSDVADIARELSSAGFLVLASGEIEAAAAARLLNVSPAHLRNLRCQLAGPQPWRRARGLVWYPLAAVIDHMTSASLRLETAVPQDAAP